MGAYILSKGRLDEFVHHLQKAYRVYGPVRRRYDHAFQEVSSAEEMDLGYRSTTLPPKRLLHLRAEMLRWRDGDLEVVEPGVDRPLLLFAVHPCDLNALLRMDGFFSRAYRDPYYWRLREASAIIALNCLEPGETCFCLSLGTGPEAREGYDLLLTDLGDRYLLEVGTPKGEAMIRGLELPGASKADLEERRGLLESAKRRFKRHIDVEGLPELAAESLDHPVWRMLGEEGGLAGCTSCLSCGSCSLVCPTCYCYEVYDAVDPDLRGGVRYRELHSCQLLEYAEVALGGNFRAERWRRVRQWMLCKFGAAAGGLYTSCVGCGRCLRLCPAGIDLTAVAEALRGDGVGEPFPA